MTVRKKQYFFRKQTIGSVAWLALSHPFNSPEDGWEAEGGEADSSEGNRTREEKCFRIAEEEERQASTITGESRAGTEWTQTWYTSVWDSHEQIMTVAPHTLLWSLLTSVARVAHFCSMLLLTLSFRHSFNFAPPLLLFAKQSQKILPCLPFKRKILNRLGGAPVPQTAPVFFVFFSLSYVASSLLEAGSSLTTTDEQHSGDRPHTETHTQNW